MRRAGERGQTLVELAAGAAALALFCGLALGVEARVSRTGKRTAGYLDDVMGCRRAVERLERDLRLAARVVPRASGLRLWIGEAAVDYTIQGDSLVRGTAAGARTVARRVARCRATVEGRLVRMELQPLRRRRDASVVAPVIHFAVAMQGVRR